MINFVKLFQNIIELIIMFRIDTYLIRTLYYNIIQIKYSYTHTNLYYVNIYLCSLNLPDARVP